MRKSLSHIALLFFPILLAAYVASCGAIGKNISEGEIIYECEPVDEDHPLAAVAPAKMSLKFKKDKFAAEMSTMGLFVTTFIADPKTKTLTQMVKVWEDKKACVEHDTDIAKELQDYKLNFKFTDEKKVIAGFNCKKAIATMVNDPTQTFEVWYTNEIIVQNPNFSNPYADIKGMLMEYRLKKFGLEMKFKACKVNDEKIPDETFTMPGFYKLITVNEMKEFFKSIQ